ncbi:hypothetical protein GJ744_011199 [Endocarpon pusillum]|uniref:Uncharacterized protein n=1 Tax=Endocarpon pusillum TaxID=364733 RepID=A0A8H7AD03_9EURO|nr:hypothetical protein GJ744_011199 [Endocarpon pusillum]
MEVEELELFRTLIQEWEAHEDSDYEEMMAEKSKEYSGKQSTFGAGIGKAIKSLLTRLHLSRERERERRARYHNSKSSDARRHEPVA